MNMCERRRCVEMGGMCRGARGGGVFMYMWRWEGGACEERRDSGGTEEDVRAREGR